MIISLNDPYVISVAVKEFKKGSIVIFPTDTSYGLGAIGLKCNERNIRRIYEIKSRPLNKPLSLLITKTMISKYLNISTKTYRFLMSVWPGSFTAVLNCTSEAFQTLSPLINRNEPQKIAFRVPNHPLLLKIIDKVGSPIIGTSANKSGSTSKYNLHSLFEDFSTDDVDLWIDGGVLTKNIPSTIVDFTDPLEPILLRRGDVEIEKILKSYNYH